MRVNINPIFNHKSLKSNFCAVLDLSVFITLQSQGAALLRAPELDRDARYSICL